MKAAVCVAAGPWGQWQAAWPLVTAASTATSSQGGERTPTVPDATVKKISTGLYQIVTLDYTFLMFHVMKWNIGIIRSCRFLKENGRPQEKHFHD